MYSPQVLDHFQNPRNAGQVSNANASAQLENPVCGDVLKLTARVTGSRIEEIRFLAKGCVPVMACASILTELATGKTVSAALSFGPDDVITAAGGLPPASSHAAHLAIDTLRSCLKGQ